MIKTMHFTAMCSIFPLMRNENWSILRSNSLFFVGCLIFKASKFLCFCVCISDLFNCFIFHINHPVNGIYAFWYSYYLLTLLTYIAWLDGFFLWRHSFFVWIQMSAVASIRYSCKKKNVSSKEKTKIMMLFIRWFFMLLNKKNDAGANIVRCVSFICAKKKFIWQYNTFGTIFYLNPSNHILRPCCSVHPWVNANFFLCCFIQSCLWIPLNLQRKPTKLNAYIYKKNIYSDSRLEASYVVHELNVLCYIFFVLWFLVVCSFQNEFASWRAHSFSFSFDGFHAWICASVILCKMLILLSMFCICEMLSLSHIHTGRLAKNSDVIILDGKRVGAGSALFARFWNMISKIGYILNFLTCNLKISKTTETHLYFWATHLIWQMWIISHLGTVNRNTLRCSRQFHRQIFYVYHATWEKKIIEKKNRRTEPEKKRSINRRLNVVIVTFSFWWIVP